MSNKSIEKYLKNNSINYLVYDDITNKINIDLNKFNTIIKSNGIKNEHPILVRALNAKITVISDLEFFYNNEKNDSYCLVTGSNGKTTVVSLLEKCINSSIAIGNNYLPLFNYINDKRYKILEASSFMLEYLNKAKYKYNIITNLFNTHLEHHKTFINYIKCKVSFLKRLNVNDYLVYNYDDLILRRIVQSYEFKKISVSLKNELCDVYVKDNCIYYRGKKEIDLNKIKLLGKHNVYNIMYCIGIIKNHNLKKNDYKSVIYEFQGVKYRLEVIYKKDIQIINDSKSTNFKALSVALDSVGNNIILIVGGKIRNDNYSLIDNHLYKINKVYCYGENREYFHEYFSNKNISSFVFETLEDVIMNLNVNKDDKVILFSPGSVSYDQFESYEQRGSIFNELIKRKFIF